jgi:YbbR domain-containing protein
VEWLWLGVSDQFGLKLISLLVGILLWAVVLGSRNVEVTKEVPIEIIAPPGLTVASDIPEKIAFRLSGPKAFLRTVLDRREDPIKVNLSGAAPGLVTYRFFSDHLRLPLGVKVQSISPSAVLVQLEVRRQKTVPIRLEMRGKLPEGLRLGKIEVKPPTLKVSGADSRIEALTVVSTVPIDLTSLRQTLEREVALDIPKGAVTLEEGVTPRVSVEILGVKANFRIKNIEVKVRSTGKVEIQDRFVSIYVQAEPDVLSQLDRSDVQAIVDLRGRTEGRYTEEVRVILPERVQLVRVTPDRIRVRIKPD